MGNAFYFILKLFVFVFSPYLNFCPDILVMQKNVLLRKLRLISKFMTSQNGKQIIKIHILHNILRSKDNQAMEFGQLIEYTMRIYFFSKAMQKMSQGD